MSDDRLGAGEALEVFPIMVEGSYRAVAYIPWYWITPHEQQAQRNHGQSLKQLAERGGLAPSEAAAVMEDRRWHKMDAREAWQAIYSTTPEPAHE